MTALRSGWGSESSLDQASPDCFRQLECDLAAIAADRAMRTNDQTRKRTNGVIAVLAAWGEMGRPDRRGAAPNPSCMAANR